MSDRLRDRFPLESTSTVYMNGKSVYNFVRFGKPGHIASVELFPADAEAIRKEFRAALAEAWEQGRDAGFDTGNEYGQGYEFPVSTDNPYREESES